MTEHCRNGIPVIRTGAEYIRSVVMHRVRHPTLHLLLIIQLIRYVCHSRSNLVPAIALHVQTILVTEDAVIHRSPVAVYLVQWSEILCRQFIL